MKDTIKTVINSIIAACLLVIFSPLIMLAFIFIYLIKYTIMIRIIIEVDEKKQVWINGNKINKTINEHHAGPIKTKSNRVPSRLKQPMDKDRICPTCGNSFKPKGPCQKYCSETCGMKPKSAKEKKKQKKEKRDRSPAQTAKEYNKKATCLKCGKEFTKTWYSQKFCIECRLQPKTEKKICLTCGREFNPSSNHQKFCSKCKSKQERTSFPSPRITPGPRPISKPLNNLNGAGGGIIEDRIHHPTPKELERSFEIENEQSGKEYTEDKNHYPTAEQIQRSKDHPYSS